MGDRGHNRHGPKRGRAVPLSRSAGNPSNTVWPAPRSTSASSGVFIRPAVWPQCTNVTDRTDRKGQTGQTRNPAIAEGPRDAGVPVEIW